MVAFRGLIAGLILTVWAWLEGARPTWRECRGSALIGILILACGAGAGPTVSLLFRQALQVFCQPFFR